MDGEEIIIDLAEGQRNITSSFSGSAWGIVSRDSDLANFYLAPGDNSITVYIKEVGSPTITAYMQWRNTHWSADGVAT